MKFTSIGFYSELRMTVQGEEATVEHNFQGKRFIKGNRHGALLFNQSQTYFWDTAAQQYLMLLDQLVITYGSNELSAYSRSRTSEFRGHSTH